jgi:hypothetical protein
VIAVGYAYFAARVAESIVRGEVSDFRLHGL